jgi:hypothetical protein
MQFVRNFKAKLDKLVKLHRTDPEATEELEAPNKFIRLLISLSTSTIVELRETGFI